MRQALQKVAIIMTMTMIASKTRIVNGTMLQVGDEIRNFVNVLNLEECVVSAFGNIYIALE